MDEHRRSAAACSLNTPLSKRKKPSEQCLLRLKQDLKNIFDNPLPGVFVEPEEGKINYIHAIIVGPDNTPYQGGYFHFVLKCPLYYPSCPPQVQFMTTDSGRVRFNPNLYSSGLVSLSDLGTFHGSSWNPEMTIQTVLVSIQSLFIEHLLADEPALGREFGTWLAKMTDYNAKLRFQTLRVTICDALEACLLGNSSYPHVPQHSVMKHFVEQYAEYEIAACSQLGDDSSVEESQQHGALLERLQDLYGRILQRNATI